MLFNASIFRWSFISEDQMYIWAKNEFFQSGNSYWMHLLTRIVNNNGIYCLMSVLSLYFYFWYIIDDFTKKNEFFLPKIDRLIYLLIRIVNNKCKYPWLCFPLIEASFSQENWWSGRKEGILYIQRRLFIEFVHEICLQQYTKLYSRYGL